MKNDRRQNRVSPWTLQTMACLNSELELPPLVKRAFQSICQSLTKSFPVFKRIFPSLWFFMQRFVCFSQRFHALNSPVLSFSLGWRVVLPNSNSAVFCLAGAVQILVLFLPDKDPDHKLETWFIITLIYFH